MQKIAALTGATLLMCLFGGAARGTGLPVCQVAQREMAQNPAADSRNVRGFVKSVVGDAITIQLPNGRLNTVMVSRRDRAALGQLVGSEVIVTPYQCSRIVFAPPPAPKPGARVGTIPQFQGVTLQRQVTPLPPRTVTPPPPIPIAPAAPIIIPQTW